MYVTKAAGRGASARKYDLLTAMGTFALACSRSEQRSILRLITLVTARYNWVLDDLSVGQREIARLWHCDERTVKREVTKLRQEGWLVLKRQGARGRVASHGIDWEAIQERTRDLWISVGPDFAARMAGQGAEPAPATASATIPSPGEGDGTEWAASRGVLHAEDPATYGAWFGPLRREGRSGGRLTLRAPSRFHATYVRTHLQLRLVAALRTVDPEIGQVDVLG